MKNEKSKKWDAYYASGQDFDRLSEEELDAIIAAAGHPETALDLGCGTGELIERLEKRGIRATGMDFSDEAMIRAKERIGSSIIECDLNNIPDNFLENSRYDLVFLKLVVAFIGNRDQLFRFVGKILSPDGTLIIVTPISNAEKATVRPEVSIDEDTLLSDLRRRFSEIRLLIEIRRKFGYVHVYIIKTPIPDGMGAEEPKAGQSLSQ